MNELIKKKEPAVNFNVSQQNLQDLKDPILGATVIKIGAIPLLQMLRAVLKLSLSFTTPPKSNLVSNYKFKCLQVTGESIWVMAARNIEKILNTQVIKKLGLDEEIRFDDLYLTAYPPTDPPDLGVGPHRDTNCKGIVATVVLTGTLPFRVCREKNLSGSVNLSVTTGEILLMRGKGFMGLPRPLHYVGEVSNSAVIQFGLRQYINPNFKKE